LLKIATSVNTIDVRRRRHEPDRARTLRRARGKDLPRWQEPIFIAMVRSSQDATTYSQIPTDRVVEIGTQVGI